MDVLKDDLDLMRQLPKLKQKISDYGINLWANNNFFIDDGLVKINQANQPALLDIIQDVLKTSSGPLVLRFPHLVEKQLDHLYTHFRRSIKENQYQGQFKAVFPLKVNQLPAVVDAIVASGKKYGYGFEAGSKAELLLAIDKTPLGHPITVNGFKDKEMIQLGFLATQMGHDITLIIEGLNELKSIINLHQKSTLALPKIGIRIRLHNSGSGTWAKSGGINAKFGLTSTELLQAMSWLREHNLLHAFTMLHFHIGSQIENILTIKKALREVGNIYAELKMLGASALSALNIGGGLAIEYAQHDSKRMTNYDLQEFSNDVVFLIKDIMQHKGVEDPDIFSESGRYIVASHAVLITPVLELFSQDYNKRELTLMDKNPPLVDELKDLLDDLKVSNCIEYLHDALDHRESILTLFDLGYITLNDRANTEILVHQIIKKSLVLMKEDFNHELECLQSKLQERYLINCSFFQSLPDFWGLQQHFPVMPLSKLDQKPMRAACLWDITCDSDGEIPFDINAPLYLHEVDLDEEDYFLAFFNVGAYQDTLSMKHNLFSHPTECSVSFDGNGFVLKGIKQSESIDETIVQMGYPYSNLFDNLFAKLEETHFDRLDEKEQSLSFIKTLLMKSSYLHKL
jgi:arginine decarboxylase